MKTRLVTLLTTMVMLAGLAFLGFLGWMWWQSRLPDRYDVMDYGVVDHGGGPHSSAQAFSVADQTGETGKPDLRVTLTAQQAKVRLASGAEVDAWSFDGRVPGPELRVRQGDLVEVTLANDDIEDGVTIHWHGVDVPNAEDGVAGVTQDAVLPGQTHTYRFRPEQVGTFWYHTHEDASNGVKRGLYGTLVILPRKPLPEKLDLALPVHTFSGRTCDRDQRRGPASSCPARHAGSAPAREHEQLADARPLGGHEGLGGRDRRSGRPACSRPGGRGDRGRSRRPLRRGLQDATGRRQRRGGEVEGGARAQPRRNRGTAGRVVTSRVRPGRPLDQPSLPRSPSSIERSASRSARSPASSTESPAATGRSTGSSTRGRRCSWSR